MKNGTKGLAIVGALTLAYVAWSGTNSRAGRSTQPEQTEPVEINDTMTSDDGPSYKLPKVKGGETYADYDRRRDDLATGQYSAGDECTQDCSGHDAGREWAEQHGITDPDDCGGRSWSFTEGCQSYARGQQGDGDTEKSESEEDRE